MQSGSGIQELMAAETRASQIVAEARIGQSFSFPERAWSLGSSGARAAPRFRDALARRV